MCTLAEVTLMILLKEETPTVTDITGLGLVDFGAKYAAGLGLF